MENEKTFTTEAKETRAEFAAAVAMYTVADNLNLRTKADTLLIMFDQMVELLILYEGADRIEKGWNYKPHKPTP